MLWVILWTRLQQVRFRSPNVLIHHPKNLCPNFVFHIFSAESLDSRVSKANMKLIFYWCLYDLLVTHRKQRCWTRRSPHLDREFILILLHSIFVAQLSWDFGSTSRDAVTRFKSNISSFRFLVDPKLEVQKWLTLLLDVYTVKSFNRNSQISNWPRLTFAWICFLSN